MIVLDYLSKEDLGLQQELIYIELTKEEADQLSTIMYLIETDPIYTRKIAAYAKDLRAQLREVI